MTKVTWPVQYKYFFVCYNYKIMQTWAHSVLRRVKVLAELSYGRAFLAA